MSENDIIFVKIEKTYAITLVQGKKALSIARAINADLISYERDEAGNELTITGDDYLDEKSRPDYASAIADIPGVEHLVGIEPLEVRSGRLIGEELEECLRRWPEGASNDG